jgi:hypothetical protein
MREGKQRERERGGKRGVRRLTEKRLVLVLEREGEWERELTYWFVRARWRELDTSLYSSILLLESSSDIPNYK